MYPILQLGPLAVRLPGLILLLGVWWAMSLTEREAPRRGLPASALYNLAFYSLVTGLLGARLWYAARFFPIYWENPLSLFSLTPATLSAGGGVFVGLAAAFAFGQRKRLPFWPTLDALTPGLALFAIFLGLAHLSSGDAFGAPTSLPWGIHLWGEDRHPSQVYEILTAGVVLAAIRQIAQRPSAPGFTFLAWIGLSAGARLFLEAFRGDSVIVLGSLRSAQLASLTALVLSLWALRIKARSENKTHES